MPRWPPTRCPPVRCPIASTRISPESRRFLRHVTAATAFGGGLDGFDLGIISVVILHINHDLGLSPAMEGLVGAASLLGIFIGAPLFGYLTDKFGRQKMFMVDIISFIAIGVAQAFVTGGVSLAILRFLLGMAIGAEYSIGAPMLSEFAPARERGSKLAFLELCWRIGFLIAVLLGYALLWLGISWKWILATSVIPALVVLGLRIGLPESPRWLLRHGREAEAREIVEKHMGPEFFEAEEFAAESVGEDGYRKLFRKGQLRRTVFVCIFWTCIVTPYFAIFTYAPKVLESLNVKSQATGTILSNTVGAIGALIGLLAIDRIGRRRMLIGPFWVQMVVLLVVGLWTNAPSWVLVLGLAVFALVNSYSDILTAVYPSEIFDTDIRSSGVGLGSAMSRIGAFLGTYLLPIGMGTIGIKWCMVIAAGLCVIGAVTGQFMAPETMNRSLTRTSTGDLMDT
ncbi:MFS transporter [Cutibacterium avidum]|uniref:MFS transporter n=3 Tax=Bacillati TaxID=1783272 RepID=A0AB35XHU2_9ACTN|nr:MFS transporter [Cutibacterium avidum]MBS6332091.1 MFS transporter [Propionibacterium sp.]MCO6633748.1 MFS transporter [Cutibacterium avidum]MCO6658044.1 MFS transporter [Cutibacterium avidum]MCO6669804.1 MFS transporter [Cutibacterium avidum]MCO6675574.1 MFS transporter [Cutibacterium avidum]